MIIVGDIASPNTYTSECLDKAFAANQQVFYNKRLICNFEGLIYDKVRLESNEPILWNHSSVLKVLNRGQKPVLGLANNHILDLPEQFTPTMNIANSEGIPICGAGKTKKEAEAPAIFQDGERKIALFNLCWDFLLYNNKNPREGVYVAEIDERKLIERIRKYKEESPDSYIITYFHWSFDLEILPFPVHRKFSRDLIDSGANVVVGAHSHCIQGGEVYKNGYIVYGLGNFFIPNDEFVSGTLVYPEFASIQLAFEWDPSTNDATCHWFKYQYTDNVHKLLHLSSEKFEDSTTLSQYSEFQEMNDKEYLSFFKNNRRKKVLIPVYQDYNRIGLNRFFTVVLKLRAGFARILARNGIIKWLN